MQRAGRGAQGGKGGSSPPVPGDGSCVCARVSVNEIGLKCAWIGCLAHITIGNRTAELLNRCLANYVKTIRPPAVVASHLLSLAVLPGLFHSGNACGK